MSFIRYSTVHQTGLILILLLVASRIFAQREGSKIWVADTGDGETASLFRAGTCAVHQPVGSVQPAAAEISLEQLHCYRDAYVQPLTSYSG